MSTSRPGAAVRPARSTAALAVAALAVTGLSACSGASTASSGAPATSTGTVGTSASPPSAPAESSTRAPQRVTAAIAPFRLPATLSRAVGFPVGGHLLVVSGLHDGDTSTDAVLDVDLAASRVSVAARLPTKVHDAAGAMLEGTPTVLGGGAASEVAAVQQYDVTNRSTRAAGTLPVPTSDAVAAATERGIVLAGGYDGTSTLTQVLLVTAPASARRLATLPVAVRYPAVAVIGAGAAQRVLLLGGESRGVAVDAVQEIDPSSGTARLVGHLPSPRTQAMAVVLGGSVFLAGGATSGSTGARILDDVLRYDPASYALTPAGTLPYATSDAAVGVVGDKAYLVGGETPARTDRTVVLTESG